MSLKKKIQTSKKKTLKKKLPPRKAFALECVTGMEYRIREYIIEDDTVLKEEIVYQNLLDLCLDKADQLFAKGVISA